jgi:outer membrane receptor protein involved in Fe transport
MDQTSLSVYAQSGIKSYPAETLSSRITRIGNDIGATIRFDSKETDKVLVSSLETEGKNREDILKLSLSGTGFIYRKLSDISYTVIMAEKPQQKIFKTGNKSVTLKGSVVDKKTKEPLVGATISLNNNSSTGTITDVEGNFVLVIDNLHQPLRVQYIGYESKIIVYKDAGNLVVELDADNFNLNEVVVTGQGAEIQKRRLSSNVTSVGSKELDNYNNGRVDQLLQNALPNVQITLSNGQPGTTSLFKSRGLSSAYSNSTPVIYVDGVRVDNLNTGATLNNMSGQNAATGSMGDIPLENIEHIEYVPGGAATTLYGSDAANGVVQIFTKKGVDKQSAFFETEIGSEVANDQFYYFDRTKDLLHQTGLIQKYRIGFDGGNSKAGYSFGGSMSNSTGTIIHNANEHKKYDLRIGTTVHFNKQLEYQSSFGTVINDFKRSRNGNQGGYTGLWFTEGSAATNFKYTDQSGNPVNYSADIDNLDDYTYTRMKAFVDKAEKLQNNQESIKRFQTSQSLVYTPVNNLTFKGIIGLDYRLNSNKNIVTNEYLIHTQQKAEGTSDAGSINNFDRNYFGLTIDVNGQHKLYYKDWLNIISTAGYQYFSTHDHQSTYNGSNVRDGAFIISGSGTTTANEWLSYLHNYGVFLQENIGIKDRYYLDLGLRGDYNTAFGDNVGWQYYPKIGISYLLSEESFMKGLNDKNLINSFRILANYGVAGSYPPPFEYQRTVTFSSFLGQQAATFGKYGNPGLAPEKKHSYEAGFNALLFNRVLNIGLTYYSALTKDALFSIPSLPSSGQETNYLSNVGKIENRGIELAVGAQIINSVDWKVKLNASYNTNYNEVLDIGTAVPFAIGGFSARTVQTVVAEGKPVGFIRAAKAVLNEDNSLKEVLQLQDLGSTIPALYGNLSLSANYKNWRLFASGDYQMGASVHSFDRQFRFSKGLKDEAIPEKALEGIEQKTAWLDFTNFFVEKADFLKIRNVSLAYTYYPKKYIQTACFSINVYNPFTFAASSVDPEALLSGARTQGAVATGGLNYSSYSLSRQIMGTIRVNF